MAVSIIPLLNRLVYYNPMTFLVQSINGLSCWFSEFPMFGSLLIPKLQP